MPPVTAGEDSAALAAVAEEEVGSARVS